MSRRRNDEDTSITRTSVDAASMELKSNHRFLRALLNDDGFRLLVVASDKNRAHDLTKKLWREGTCDTCSFTTDVGRAQELLHDGKCDMVVIEEILRNDIYVNGAGHVPIVTIGDDDAEAVATVKNMRLQDPQRPHAH